MHLLYINLESREREEVHFQSPAHLWQLRQSLSTILQAQKARESQVSLTIPTKALVPGILVSLYLEQ